MASTSTAATPSSEQQQKLDLAITLLINSWPALNLAVQSSWGGPNSADKRDWLCGAISDIFMTRPETDSYDIEDILVQVLSDEFDVAVDDGSAGMVADQIMNVKARIEMGDYQEVDRLWAEYKEKRERKGAEQNLFKHVDTKDEDQETDDDDEEDSDDDEDMQDAPSLVTRPPTQRVEPEVDEDGFTKVVGKKKR
ncbi:hypothetical protein UA08_03369 [Talaromyces atroroseus]|uniref:Pre-rRNA-processing protein TSR2 n=1 Tax=Talaromyces atroroseus TaxID=1441469 RepID=A0A225ASY6_TALAT|nr:hypothetical protein UA08_03369 [Talaromyces atroroseus]OKL61464.1 hypothetical protein UA08_03369 [Talaromyces atroroseus]